MSNHRNPNRRDLLKTTGLAAAGLAMSPLLSRVSQAADAGPAKKILFFTRSQTFQHSVVSRDSKNPDKLGFAEQILTDLGAKNGFEVSCSKDGALFTPEYVAKFDALAFYTTGDLLLDPPKPTDNGTKMSAAGKAAFLDAIKNGKGFISIHCGSDTFHSNSKLSKELIRNVNDKGEDAFDPYIQMLGGEFITHGNQQKSTLKLVDPKFPGAAGLAGANFQEEWYALKNFAPDLHVILVQETAGMTGPMYQRKPYPETWARMHGKGRVFFTSLGHREDVWQKPEYLALLVGAMNWTTGKVDAEIPANIKEVCPEADAKQPGAAAPKT